jgi:hypothetical protein
MSVKDRIKEYISFKKISEREFCRTINVAGTYVNSIRVSIQPDKLLRIALHFPDLNTEWLLTGEGEMLKSEVEQFPADVMELLREKDRQIAEKDAQIKRLFDLLEKK